MGDTPDASTRAPVGPVDGAVIADATIPDAAQVPDGSPQDTGCLMGGRTYAIGEGAQPAGVLARTSLANGKCAAVRECDWRDNVGMEQRTCDYSPCQLWQSVSLGDGFALRSEVSGRCLQPSDDATAPSVDLVQVGCVGSATQAFEAVCEGQDGWRLVHRAAGLVITIADASTCDGTPLTLEPDVGRVHQRFQIEARANVFEPLLATAEEGSGLTWRFTVEDPGSGWELPGFDDSSWSDGRAGFGAMSEDVQTPWSTADIWLRLESTLPDPIPDDLALRLRRDEDAWVYFNGQLALFSQGWGADYFQAIPNATAVAALSPGRNTLAVQCHNSTGPQFIDVGLGTYRWPER